MRSSSNGGTAIHSSGSRPIGLGHTTTGTDQEIAAYVAHWPLGTRERMAFDLLYYTAQRIGDVARMRRDNINGDDPYVKQQKTGAELRIPVHPALRRSLNAYGIRGQHLVGRIDGKPISADTLRTLFMEAARLGFRQNACRMASARPCCARWPRAAPAPM
jgi:integrase